MPSCHSKEFGEIEYAPEAIVHFPAGLPAFENEKSFLLIERSESAPVVFLQSLVTPNLLFLALPARFVDPRFQIALSPEDRQVLGVGEGVREPVEGEDLISLALLTVVPGQEVTANLLAPVVIGGRTRKALQIVQPDSGYSVNQPLVGAAPACL
jgi:flagellar assembly factor FliW